MSSINKAIANIRRMVNTDIDVFIALDRRIGCGQCRISHRDMVLTNLGRPPNFNIVCDVDDNMAGFVIARLAYLGIPPVGICLIHCIAVDPKYQHRNIATDLVKGVLNLCYAEGICKARMLIDKGDIRLRSFAEELEFSPSSIVNYDVDFDYVRSKSWTRLW